jgi:16S rRNA (cytosine967-C5)-methyltransferase
MRCSAFPADAAILAAAHGNLPPGAHPEWLLRRWRATGPTTGRNPWPWQREPPMWLRVNRRRGSRDEYRLRLLAAGQTRQRAHCAGCAAPEQPVDVGQLPGFADGDVSVQDLSAQLVPDCSMRAGHVLDACAAPGWQGLPPARASRRSRVWSR